MNKIKIWLKYAIVEFSRLVLFLGVILCASGMGTILYKIYESHFDNDYTLEAMPYLVAFLSYLVGVYFLDKFLFKYLISTKAELK